MLCQSWLSLRSSHDRFIENGSYLYPSRPFAPTMTLTLNPLDWDELHQQAPVTCSRNVLVDDFETIEGVPQYLGWGYTRSMELLPGVCLDISEEQFHRDWQTHSPVHEHLVQCLVLLSGQLHGEDIYPTFGGDRSYFSGSGISPSYNTQCERSQRMIRVNVELLPGVMEELFADLTGGNGALLKLLLKQNDWKVSFFPRVTAEIRQVAQQIIEAPFWGETRRLYLQEKVLELLTLQMGAILADPQLSQLLTGRKSERIARIYHAKEVLASRIENPPSLLELARQVGISDRTLRRGFQDVFAALRLIPNGSLL
jgi:AraC-like DNA-binding protein